MLGGGSRLQVPGTGRNVTEMTFQPDPVRRVGAGEGADTPLGTITFDGEEWIEYGPTEARRRIGFHDYTRLYDEPGLYDHVFVELLGMSTAPQVVGLYASALRSLSRDPADERVLDLGAGSGIGGVELRNLRVGEIVAVDREPAAARAAARDRPSVYDDYVVGEVPEAIERLRPRAPFTALLAVASVGADALGPAQLAQLIDALLTPNALVAFAVSEALYPALVDDLAGRVGMDVVRAVNYVHRRQTDGRDHRATVVVGQLGSAAAHQ